ncbi:MAG TPA: ribosome recycling factor [Gammaproteobacteria bacterium]
MINDIKKDAEKRMQRSIEALIHELSRMRTGRASTGLLDHINVEYYGSTMPIKQVANVVVEDARTLSITPWEKQMIPVIEKAIMTAELGLNPVTAGSVIRVPMPPLTEERRREFVRLVKQEGENARVAVRNIRRDANSDLKQLLKDKEITEDEDRRAQDAIQKLTDKYIEEIEVILEKKEKDIMEV